MKEVPKAVIYARISTTEQNVDTQLIPLREFCKVRGCKIVEEYVDLGESGRKVSRPGLQRMLADMRQGRFDAIVVYKMDRVGRSFQHFWTIFQEFSNRGVRFISITEGIDTDKNNPAGELIKNILMSVAQFEREIIIERVRAGLSRAKKDGKKLGRPKGSTDKSKRSVSGYHIRYAGKSKEERRLGPRKEKEKSND